MPSAAHMRPNWVNGSAPGLAFLLDRAPHIHILPIRIERPQESRTLDPLRKTATAAQIVSCAPNRLAPSRRVVHQRQHSSAGPDLRTTDESCHRAAPARRSAPCAPAVGDADCACARDSTAPPPTSSAAAFRGRRDPVFARQMLRRQRRPNRSSTSPLYFSRTSVSPLAPPAPSPDSRPSRADVSGPSRPHRDTVDTTASAWR